MREEGKDGMGVTVRGRALREEECERAVNGMRGGEAGSRRRGISMCSEGVCVSVKPMEELGYKRVIQCRTMYQGSSLSAARILQDLPLICSRLPKGDLSGDEQ